MVQIESPGSLGLARPQRAGRRMKPPAFSVDRQRGAPSLWAPLATTIVGLFLGLCGTVAFVAGFVWLQYSPVWLAGVLLFALSLVAISSGMLSYKTQVDRFKHETQRQHYATPYGRLHAEVSMEITQGWTRQAHFACTCSASNGDVLFYSIELTANSQRVLRRLSALWKCSGKMPNCFSGSPQ